MLNYQRVTPSEMTKSARDPQSTRSPGMRFFDSFLGWRKLRWKLIADLPTTSWTSTWASLVWRQANQIVVNLVPLRHLFWCLLTVIYIIYIIYIILIYIYMSFLQIPCQHIQPLRNPLNWILSPMFRGFVARWGGETLRGQRNLPLGRGQGSGEIGGSDLGGDFSSKYTKCNEDIIGYIYIYKWDIYIYTHRYTHIYLFDQIDVIFLINVHLWFISRAPPPLFSPK